MKRTGIAIGLVVFLSLARSAFAADMDTLDRKLSAVVENQERILQQLAEVKSELQIVKVRASDH